MNGVISIEIANRVNGVKRDFKRADAIVDNVVNFLWKRDLQIGAFCAKIIGAKAGINVDGDCDGGILDRINGSWRRAALADDQTADIVVFFRVVHAVRVGNDEMAVGFCARNDCVLL